MKRFLLGLLLLVFILVTVLLINVWRTPSQQLQVPFQTLLPLPDSSITHLQRAITYKTISYDDSSRRDTAQFGQFQRYLQRAYPRVHQTLTRERVNNYTLLYTWPGKNAKSSPIVLLAHQDVVPVEEATRSQWHSDPFGGIIKNNFIYGRGSFDDKLSVIAILETVEILLTEGYEPPQPILLVFGHDEEAGGRGAGAAARRLQVRQIKPAFVLDEGGIITREKIPGMKGKAVALIGTAEKGFVTVQLAVNIPGGHSSMPEKETAIDVLSQAIVKLRKNQFEPYFSQATKDFMRHLGPEMPFFQRFVFANQWLFTPVVKQIYAASAAGNAIIRTTTAPTIIQAGVKANVIPSTATGIVNFRTLPGVTSQDVFRHIQEVVMDSRVKASIKGFTREASPVSSSSSPAYHKIATTAKTVHPDLITAPYLMVGGTDAHAFTKITPNVYRLQTVTDPVGFHGINECISLLDYQRMFNFYYRLLKS
jgi:carboxypeptidase PM20D1